MNGIVGDSCRRGVPRDAGLRPHFRRFKNRAVQDPHHFPAEFRVLRQCHCPGDNRGMHVVYRKQSVMPGQSAAAVIARSKATKQSPVGWASCPSFVTRDSDPGFGKWRAGTPAATKS